MIKSLIKTIVRHLPFKAQSLRIIAAWPPVLKNRLIVRVCSTLLLALDSNQILATNLGIDNSFRISLKTNGMLPVYLFGKPEIYSGERGPLFLARHFARTCGWFIDIGANIGYYTYFIRKTTETKIVAFEPNEELFDLIQTTIGRNSLRDIAVYRLGISDKNGAADFYLDKGNHTMGSLLAEFGNTHTLEKAAIDIIDYDTFAVENGLTGNAVVKVDIENAEQLFVAGARNSLKSIRYLIIELLYPARRAKLLEALIHDFDFYAYYINDYSLENMEYEDNRYAPGEFNWLFCRESPNELTIALAGTPFRIIPALPVPNVDFNHTPYSEDFVVKLLGA